MTPRGYTAAVTAVALLLAGRFLAVVELSALGVALAAAVAVSVAAVCLRRRPPLVASRSSVPAAVHAGGVFRVEIRLENRGHRRTPVLLVTEHVEGGRRQVNLGLAPLPGGGRTAALYRLTTAARGDVSVGPLQVTLTDGLGFARRRWMLLAPEALLVLPEVAPVRLPDGLAAATSAVQARRRRRPVSASGEFRSLRPYVSGDDPRRVHWRSSARTGELVVREDESTPPDRLAVVLDDVAGPGWSSPGQRVRRGGDGRTGGDGAFELAVSAAASVVLAAARRDRPMVLATTSGHRSTVKGDPASIRAALAFLARLDGPTPLRGPPTATDGALPDHDGPVVVVTAAGGERARRLAATLSRSGSVVLLASPGRAGHSRYSGHSGGHGGHRGGTRPGDHGDGDAAVPPSTGTTGTTGTTGVPILAITSLDDLVATAGGTGTVGGGHSATYRPVRPPAAVVRTHRTQRPTP